jgi:hypothetical protein
MELKKNPYMPELDDVEKATLLKWLNKRAVKAQLKKGSPLSLTFNGTSIGTQIIAQLDKGKTVDYVPLSCDITNYGNW